MDTPTTPPPASIPPGTTLADILRYLLGTGIGSKSIKGLVAAILTWWGVDKAKEFKNGASVSDLTAWHAEVSNRLERLEAYAVAPATQPDPFEVRRQAAIRRPIPPFPSTNRIRP
jgi:hypothetical protein